jgi:hypothetical protein
MPNDNESQILFTVRKRPGRLTDGVTRLVLRTTNPQASGGTPLFPPKGPPPPPTRSLIAGYMEEVVVGDVHYTQLVIDFQNEGELETE